jgi:serine/threonine protein phosphatase PrpC
VSAGGGWTAGAPRGFGATDTGRVRSHNEDAVLVADDAGLYLVADGIGGYARGEVASGMVVETVSGAWEPVAPAAAPEALAAAIREANRRVFEAARHASPEPGSEGERMGSTLVALYLAEATATIAHVGDSRAYRFRDGGLAALTVDHSVGAQRAALGETVGARFRNLLTRAVGIAPEVEVEVRQEPVRPGDLFLLCSDGLTNMVDEARIAAVLAEGGPLDAACRALLAEANANGGRDNATVVLVRC